LGEHLLLLILGMGIGLLAAMLPLIPVWLGNQSGFPWRSLIITLTAILLNGWLWTEWAARKSSSGSLTAALRGE
jgi:hypothetical protein